MQEIDFIKIFLTRLDDANFEYMATGAVASIFYGKPRLTHDIDIVFSLEKKNQHI